MKPIKKILEFIFETLASIFLMVAVVAAIVSVIALIIGLIPILIFAVGVLFTNPSFTIFLVGAYILLYGVTISGVAFIVFDALAIFSGYLANKVEK